MATIKFKTTVRNAMAQKIIDALDAGSGAGKLKFYTGVMPANGDTEISTQTLLGTLTCSDPSGSVASGVLTFGSITQDSAADATGTAAFAALVDSDDNIVCYLDVTDSAGSGALKLNTVSIIAGGPIQMTSLAITVGA